MHGPLGMTGSTRATEQVEKPVAEFWYSIQPLGDGIYRFGEICADPQSYIAGLRRMCDLPVSYVYPGRYGHFDGDRMTKVIGQQFAEPGGAS